MVRDPIKNSVLSSAEPHWFGGINCWDLLESITAAAHVRILVAAVGPTGTFERPGEADFLAVMQGNLRVVTSGSTVGAGWWAKMHKKKRGITVRTKFPPNSRLVWYPDNFEPHRGGGLIATEARLRRRPPRAEASIIGKIEDITAVGNRRTLAKFVAAMSSGIILSQLSRSP